jgi:hypothetical protein
MHKSYAASMMNLDVSIGLIGWNLGAFESENNALQANGDQNGSQNMVDPVVDDHHHDFCIV